MAGDVVAGDVVAGDVVTETCISTGSHASVWRGRDLRDGSPVAVKVAAPGEAAALRVRAEGRALAAVDCPHVVHLHRTSEHEGRPVLVLELLPGPTLRDAPRADVLTTARRGAVLAAGLSSVHGAGLVHGDVSPGNAVLDGEGVPRLVDLGTARPVGEAVLAGAVVGTVPFLAPEVVRGEAWTPAADVFALALMLLELLTGRREYPSEGIDGAVERLHRAPSVPTSLPVGVAHPLGRALAADPGRRPSAAGLSTALAAVAPGPSDVGPSARRLPVAVAAVPPAGPEQAERTVALSSVDLAGAA